MSISKFQLSPIASLLVLVIAFASTDIWLLFRLKHQDTVVASLEYENGIMSQSPVPGQVVTLIQGISNANHKPEAIRLGTGHELMLLVFTKDCKYCNQNWEYWDRLFKRPTPGREIYFVTTDGTVSADYLARHPLLSKYDVLLNVDPSVLQAMNVLSTPQTILVRDGRVRHVWTGLLSQNDRDEILHSAPKPVTE